MFENALVYTVLIYDGMYKQVSYKLIIRLVYTNITDSNKKKN